MEKKSVVFALILSVAALSGCATLDNQSGTSKNEKTAEAVGVGAVAGGIIGKLFGVDPRLTALAGGLFAGIFEYKHATDLEIKTAQKQADALKQVGIESEVKTAQVDVKDSKGVTTKTEELKTFVAHSTSDQAVGAVAATAKESAFGGQIVVVSPKADVPHIRGIIDADLAGKKDPVKVAYFTPAEAAKMGAKPGIAWVPKHPAVLAGSTKKVA